MVYNFASCCDSRPGILHNISVKCESKTLGCMVDVASKEARDLEGTADLLLMTVHECYGLIGSCSVEVHLRGF